MTPRKLFIWLGLCLCFGLFEYVLICWVDLPLSQFMRLLDNQQPWLINSFRAITDFAKSGWYLWPSGIGALICLATLRRQGLKPEHRRQLAEWGRQSLFVFICVALSGIVTDILKPLIGRARPIEFERAQIYGFHPLTFQAVFNSMPSGHATTAATMAMAAWLLWPKYRWPWAILCFVLVISRIMVNAHYLSDICVGAMIGGLTIVAINRFQNFYGIKTITNGLFPLTDYGNIPKTEV